MFGVNGVVVESQTVASPVSDDGAECVMVDGIFFVFAPKCAVAVEFFFPKRRPVQHLRRMVCQQVSPTLGATFFMMCLRLLMHRPVWIRGQPERFHLAKCFRILSCMLKVESCRRVVWMWRCVDFFHLWWSSLVSGSCESLVMCFLIVFWSIPC